MGYSGTGTLLVEAGGMVSNTTGSIGFNGGSTARRRSPARARMDQLGNLYVGGGSVDPGGSGELSVKTVDWSKSLARSKSGTPAW